MLQESNDAHSAALKKVVDDDSMMIKSPLLPLRDEETNGNLPGIERRNDDSIASLSQRQQLFSHRHHDRLRAGPHQHVRVVDCVIIGSGASGLQCACSLLEEAPGISILLLEARDRLGGRILSTHETRKFCDQSLQLQQGCDERGEDTTRSFYRDLGAAWVHGILSDTDGEGASLVGGTSHPGTTDETTQVKVNPMVELLEQATSEGNLHRRPTPSSWAKRDDEILMSKSIHSSLLSILSLLSPVLDPVVQGNPWTRPYSILHKTGAISLFLNGERVPNDSSLVLRAIERHFEALTPPSRPTCTCDTQGGNGSKTEWSERQVLDTEVGPMPHDHITAHMPSKRPRLSSSTSDDDQDQLELLTPFYMFLAENWDGISSRDSQLGHAHYKATDGAESTADSASSSLSTTDERYNCVGDYEGPHCKVKTGMITLLIPLIEKVCSQSDILHLNEPVVTVTAERKERGRVWIETTTGMVVEAKCCVSTIPIGCLQDKAKSLFDPTLSNEKILAIQSVWPGSYKKVFLTFDHIFWPKEEPFIGLVRKEKYQSHQTAEPGVQNYPDRLPGNYLFLSNLWARDGIPCIEAVLSGDLGVWAFGKDVNVIRHGIIEFIEASMGTVNLSKSCVGCHVTRWEEDEYTRGSYSSCRFDTKDRHVAALRQSEWDGRLVFAGESTESAHMGSVHAALLSGKRAAQEVSNFLAGAST
jgi:monoamine oxidase